jgi:WD40 repeat protein
MLRRILLSVLFMGGWIDVGFGQQERPYLVVDAGGHTAPVRKLMFTRDGKDLITVSEDKTIRFWNTKTGVSERTLRPPIGPGLAGSLYAADLSPDGKTLAVAGYGFPGVSPIFLIDIDSGVLRKALRGHNGPIRALAFAPRGNALASGGDDQTVRLWDLTTGNELRILRGHKSRITDLAFAPDGRRIASASWDDAARIWDLGSAQTQALLRHIDSAAHAVAWSSDGERLVTGGKDDSSLLLWDHTGQLLHSFPNLEGPITSFRFTSANRELLFGNWKAGNMLDLYKKGAVRSWRVHWGYINSVDLLPGGKFAASTGGDDHEAFIWPTVDGNQSGTKIVGKGRTTWIGAWHPSGNIIGWGNSFGGFTVAVSSPLQFAFSLENLEMSEKPDATFSGKYLARRSATLTLADKSIEYSRGDFRRALPLPDTNDTVTCGTLLAERYAAIGTKHGMFLYDVETGRIVRRYTGIGGIVHSVTNSPNGRYLLTASHDQIMRIFALENEDPLLSLSFIGGEWIAWTPQGYYAASPGGERVMGWHINNGLDQMASYTTANNFRKSLYRPDVIRELLKAGSIERALELADAERGRPTKLVKFGNVLPPRVKITSPASALAVKDNVLEVRAHAASADEHPITALHLLMNGKPLRDQGGEFRVAAPKVGDVEKTWTITLSPGKHRFSVRADSTAVSAESAPVDVQLVAPDLIEQVRVPNLYVLAVGVSDYPGDLKLNYAAKDAEAIAKTLQVHSKTLYGKIEIKELTNQKATQRDILRGISWLGKQMTQRDVGLLFMAGHGQMTSGGFFYLPADVDPDDVAATGVAGEQIKSQLAAMPGRIIFALDACHAGGFDGKRSNSSLTDDLIRDLVNDDRGVIALCASTGRQFALESNEHRQGLFTLALVEGLQGKAQKVDGAVYLHHLDAYVTDRVKELSQGRQSPTTARPTSVTPFPLSRP